MKLALLPIALLALNLQSLAQAYPVQVVNVYDSASPERVGRTYPAAYYLQPAHQTYGYGYGRLSHPPQTVVRYRAISPYGHPSTRTYSYGYGYQNGAQPVQVPVAHTCRFNSSGALVGAALGGFTSAALAARPSDRRWAVPVGVALGGGIGGLANGC